MSAVIDHLCAGQRHRVLKDFVDAGGVRHAAGECGVIRKIGIDWTTREIQIDWERDGAHETIRFAFESESGPGNGRMRTYFGTGEMVSPVRIEKQAPSPVVSPLQESEKCFRQTPADLLGELEALVEQGRYDREILRVLRRIVKLAEQRRFEEAEGCLRSLKDVGSDVKAIVLSQAAERWAGTPADDRQIYIWLRDRAIACWHAWGAEATSGGDGAARMLEIEPALDRFTELDRADERPR